MNKPVPTAKKIYTNKPLTAQQRRVGEAREILDAIGHESEKEGIKWTQHFMNEHDREQRLKIEIIVAKLDVARDKSKKKYKELLYAILWQELANLDIPEGYATNAQLTDEGLVGLLRDGFQKTYYMAFKPCGESKKDYFAVIAIAAEAEDKAIELENARYNIIQ